MILSYMSSGKYRNLWVESSVNIYRWYYIYCHVFFPELGQLTHPTPCFNVEACFVSFCRSCKWFQGNVYMYVCVWGVCVYLYIFMCGGVCVFIYIYIHMIYGVPVKVKVYVLNINRGLPILKEEWSYKTMRDSLFFKLPQKSGSKICQCCCYVIEYQQMP